MAFFTHPRINTLVQVSAVAATMAALGFAVLAWDRTKDLLAAVCFGIAALFGVVFVLGMVWHFVEPWWTRKRSGSNHHLGINTTTWSLDARIGRGLFLYLHVKNSGSTRTFQVVVDSISGLNDPPPTPYYAPWFDPYDSIPRDLSERQSLQIASGGFGNVPLLGLFMYAQEGEHLNLFEIWRAQARHDGYHRATDDLFPDITINIRLLTESGNEQRHYRVRGGHPVGIWIEEDIATPRVEGEMIERFSKNALRAADALNEGSRRVNDRGLFQRQMLAWRSIVIDYLQVRGITATPMFSDDLPEDVSHAEIVARQWATRLARWLPERAPSQSQSRSRNSTLKR